LFFFVVFDCTDELETFPILIGGFFFDDDFESLVIRETSGVHAVVDVIPLSGVAFFHSNIYFLI
jgi:hypothetical protein